LRGARGVLGFAASTVAAYSVGQQIAIGVLTFGIGFVPQVVGGTLFGVAGISSDIPARDATRVDPARTLRD